MDTVMVDEKWFNLTKDGFSYIGAPGEKKPHRTTRHKGYIGKIMFLCAQARPRRLANGTWWDGKLAMIPIGEESLAERTSTRRAAGTPVWKNIQVKKDVYRRLMLEVVVEIIERWPSSDWNIRDKIRIQQDGAPSHFSPDDQGWLNGLLALGVAHKIEVFNQSAQSPDTNICDLGLFRAIDAAYKREVPRNNFDIIECVQRTYRNYPLKEINHMWLSHQCCMNMIIDSHGDNDWPLPHMEKEKLEREGRLPLVLPVTVEALPFLEGNGAAMVG
jgi:hypothetical protein